jgi:hypothetical protein
MGFGSLQHTSGSKVHVIVGFTCPLRSAFRVWVPSWRLTPFKPQPVLFHTGSAHGIHPSELVPSRRYPGVSAGKDPPTVPPAVVPGRRSAGPARQAAVPGFHPCRKFRSPDGGFSTAAAESSLGVHPSRASREGLDQDFARSPLTRFVNGTANGPADRRPRVSIDLRLGSSGPRGFPQNDRTSNPLRVCAPAESSTYGRTFTRAMCSPSAATNVTAACPTLLR